MAAAKIRNRKNVYPEYRGICLSSGVFSGLWLIPILGVRFCMVVQCHEQAERNRVMHTLQTTRYRD